MLQASFRKKTFADKKTATKIFKHFKVMR